MFAELRELLRSGAIRRHQLGSKGQKAVHACMKKHGLMTRPDMSIKVEHKLRDLLMNALAAENRHRTATTAAAAKRIQKAELHTPVSASLEWIAILLSHRLIPLTAVLELLQQLAIEHIVRLHGDGTLRMLLCRDVVALSGIRHRT